MLLYALLLICYVYAAKADPCVPREFQNGTVCVCNSTYCDSTPIYELPETGSYIKYTSNEAGLRLNMTQGVFSDVSSSEGELFVLERNITFQSIHGFGGAFTDTAAINIKLLSEGAQRNLLSSYFTKEGNAYNLGRVPIAGTDFSTRKYTYDDFDGDVLLTNFSLADEDLYYKIPIMQDALKLSPELRFIAASWTAPTWMKTNDDYVGVGYLFEEYYQLYADYLIRFFDEYDKYGLEMWAISTGNEPLDASIKGFDLTSMSWNASSMGVWIVENFGPTLSKTKYNGTLILTFDDQRPYLTTFIETLFENEAAKNYIAGIGDHWYCNSGALSSEVEETVFAAQSICVEFANSSVLQDVHALFPDKFLLMTEASVATSLSDGKLVLGSWATGQEYIMDIIDNLRNWATGWMDWNLAVNESGGPKWREDDVQCPIIVNAEDDEFYKQPLFYAIAHFSKFIPRGSVRVEFAQNRVTNGTLDSVAFVTPENDTVLVIFNKWSDERQVTIYDPQRGNIDLQLSAHSVQTIVYK